MDARWEACMSPLLPNRSAGGGGNADLTSAERRFSKCRGSSETTRAKRFGTRSRQAVVQSRASALLLGIARARLLTLLSKPPEFHLFGEALQVHCGMRHRAAYAGSRPVCG